jgi:hypothetical protein
MLCNSFQNLSVKEKVEFIGLLSHAVMNDEHSFIIGSELINKATRKGIFENIVINPPRTQEPGSY